MSLASLSVLYKVPEVLERPNCAGCAASVKNAPAELCQTIPALPLFRPFCARDGDGERAQKSNWQRFPEIPEQQSVLVLSPGAGQGEFHVTGSPGASSKPKTPQRGRS